MSSVGNKGGYLPGVTVGHTRLWFRTAPTARLVRSNINTRVSETQCYVDLVENAIRGDASECTQHFKKHAVSMLLPF